MTPSEQERGPVQSRAAAGWLIGLSGAAVGLIRAVDAPVIRMGRAAANDVVIPADTVSTRHAEIRCENGRCVLADLDSTNGTYLNGERVTEAPLAAPATIRLGTNGPEFEFCERAPDREELNRTLVIPASAVNLHPATLDAHERLLAQAVERARRARRMAAGNQTLVLMRDALNAALRRHGRKWKAVTATLVAALIALSGFGYWKFRSLKQEKNSIDVRIREVEERLAKASANSEEADRLLAQLDEYEGQAQSLERTVLYRISKPAEPDPVRREIRRLMAEFGAEAYSIPPEFVEQVNRYLDQYRGPERAHIERALGRARPQMQQMRRVFEQEHLPPDLAYIALVESALDSSQSSRAGAAGLWQFTPATARAYGLTVNSEVDERLDPVKATRAGCRFIRELILEFGAGSSVMLALAAYNSGPAKVKSAVRKVSDPIRQRNFWFLYRTRALPPETRAYVPKVFAVMILARNPERFGV